MILSGWLMMGTCRRLVIRYMKILMGLRKLLPSSANWLACKGKLVTIS